MICPIKTFCLIYTPCSLQFFISTQDCFSCLPLPFLFASFFISYFLQFKVSFIEYFFQLLLGITRMFEFFLLVFVCFKLFFDQVFILWLLSKFLESCIKHLGIFGNFIFNYVFNIHNFVLIYPAISFTHFFNFVFVLFSLFNKSWVIVLSCDIFILLL